MNLLRSYTRASALLLLLGLCATTLTAQCPTPDLAVINGCFTVPNPTNPDRTVEVELIVLRNGPTNFPVDDLGIDLPFNGFGDRNGDVGRGSDGADFKCGFKPITEVELGGCANAVALGPQSIIPARAVVVFVTTGNANLNSLAGQDFSTLCSSGETVYVLQNACERSVAALANSTSGTNTLRTIGVHCPGTINELTYDISKVPAGDGAFYDRTRDEYGQRDDCSIPAPISPAPCVPDSTFREIELLTGQIYIAPETGESLDENMPRDTVALLRSDGCDSILVINLNYSGVEDTTVVDTMTVDTTVMDTVGTDTVLLDTFTLAPRITVFLPTAFSPNADGVNDTYAVGIPLDLGGVAELAIYDRWGGLAYRGIEPWDGRIDGRPAEQGSYLAQVLYTTAAGDRRGFSTAFVLIR